MTQEITATQSECLCAANLFYKRYKSQIEKLFAETFGAGVPSSFALSAGAEEDTDDYYQFAYRRALLSDPGRFTDYSLSGIGAEEEDNGAILGYYQKLFDHHLQFLYDEPQGEEEESHRYFKFPRSGKQEYEESLEYTHVELKDEGPWMSDSQRRAENYLKMHQIYELFHFLGSHLVSTITDCVENPVEFLINLLDKCLKYRHGLMKPPLLFTEKHVVSLFESMDPMFAGFIQVEQYHTGMQTLGIREYELFPPLNRDGFVTKRIFVLEALKQLQLQLDAMIKNFAPVSKEQLAIEPAMPIMDGYEDTYSDNQQEEYVTYTTCHLYNTLEKRNLISQ